jgi:hypothetical protein
MMMTMMKLLAGLALALPLPAAAHEIWVERDAHGPARIYLGEPAEVVIPNFIACKIRNCWRPAARPRRWSAGPTISKRRSPARATFA